MAGGDRLWLLALWAVATAYNLFKPYHIDDAAHLEIARWIAGHPLHPMSGTLNWEGVDAPIAATNQPHLYFYLLAAWGAVAGYGEGAMHALQSLGTLGCVLLFHRLARGLVPEMALWLTGMLVLGPAVIVEQNLMVDVPLLGVWLGFFNLLLLGVAGERQGRRFVWLGVVCAAAILIKYSSLVLVPVLVAAVVLERRWRLAWVVAIPVGVLAAWSLFNVWDYGAVHIATRREGAGQGGLSIVSRAGAWVLAFGALTPLGVLVLGEGRAEWRRALYGVVGVGFAGLVVGVGAGVVGDGMSDWVLWAVFMANAVVMGAALAPGGWGILRGSVLGGVRLEGRGLVEGYLWLWVVGTTVFYVLFAPFIASRHVLLILPAVLLLMGMRWGGQVAWGTRAFGLGLTVVVSGGLCLSDWRFADFYRSEAARLAPEVRAGHAWTAGHWGWQWYAGEAGLRQVDIGHSVLRPGDLFVVGEDVSHRGLVGGGPAMRLVRMDQGGGGVASLMCAARTARFYLSGRCWRLGR